jgi:Methyltransferase domain
VCTNRRWRIAKLIIAALKLHEKMNASDQQTPSQMKEWEGIAYESYWRRKHLISQPVPAFPVRRWWKTDGLSEIERIYFEAVKGSPNVLDVGAGDLSIARKFKSAGYSGEYHTLDPGVEYAHTYKDLTEVRRTYRAILYMDVIEHLPFQQGLRMLTELSDLLEPGGVMVVQTPNARCIRYPASWDMTHLHSYNAHDLWAYMSGLGLAVEGFRIVFGLERPSIGDRIRGLAGAFIATRLLGCDYADNIAMIGRKSEDRVRPIPAAHISNP